MSKTIWAKMIGIFSIVTIALGGSWFYLDQRIGAIKEEQGINFKKWNQIIVKSRKIAESSLKFERSTMKNLATKSIAGDAEASFDGKAEYEESLSAINFLLKSNVIEPKLIKGLELKRKTSYKKGKELMEAFSEEDPLVKEKSMNSFILASSNFQETFKSIEEMLEIEREKASASFAKSLVEIKWVLLFSSLASAIIFGLCLLMFGGWIAKMIRLTSEQLLQSVENLISYAGGLEVKSNDLNSVVASQASSLQHTASSIDEVSMMVQKSSQSAVDSTKVSKQSTDTAHSGKRTIETMIESIENISTSNSEIMMEIKRNNDEISNIVNVISEIGEKTKVINDIVFQTKLLSFNASVEAARAGEHGKGFSVVAEEVGNLAAMSGKAAEEISGMLDDSIKEVTGIVDRTKSKVESLISDGKMKVDRGTETAHKCGESLDEILANVSTVNEMVEEIASASKEQAIGIGEITSTMQELDKTTHQSSSVANESLDMAKNITIQSKTVMSVASGLLEMVEIRKKDNSASYTETESGSSIEEKNENQNVIPIVSVATSEVSSHSHESEEKKVSGSDVTIPSASDPRFEDL